MIGTCELCGRDELTLTDHHLIPRSQHKKKFKKLYTREELNKTADTCRPCHSHIHSLFTEKELAENLNTIEKLKATPEVQKWLGWITKRKFGAVLIR